MKWDGVRAIALVGASEVHLLTRKGNEVTASYPDIVAGLAAAMPAGSGEPVTLDGEIVVLDRSGRSSFGLSQTRMNLAAAEARTTKARVPAHFLLFDVLERNGLLPLDQAYDSRSSELGARARARARGSR